MTDKGESYRSVWTYLSKTAHRLAWVDVDGVKTRYIEAGAVDAPVVIMVHGLGGSLENFSANIAAHAEKFRVYAYDLTGCGWTDRPDFPYSGQAHAKHLLGFMDALGVDRASFIGVSLGSKLAGYFAHLHPERTKSFIMVAAAGVTADEAAQRAWGMKGFAGRQAAADNPNWETITDVFRYLILDEKNIVDDIVAMRLSVYSDPSAQAAMGNVLSGGVGEWMTQDAWKGLQAPILIVGSPDGAAPFYANSKLIETLSPNARRVDIPHTDHWAQFEAPEVFNPLSIAFLEETA